ncbi:MAG TPA: hypothetical protein PL051_01200 [Candidatus Saccharibacteria bacterium]|nr:hypothetical protein [Candidatus Saccharibacteria bacterium]
MKDRFTARSLRIVLLILLVLTFIAGITAFLFAKDFLSSYATKVSERNALANIGDSNLQALNKLETYLETNKEVIDKTKNIVAESKEYRYQNQIISDLNSFAASANVVIDKFDFVTNQAEAAAEGTAEATADASSTAPAAQTSSLRSTRATVTVSTPVLYNSLLKFIQKIEQNKTKMQITSIGLIRSTDPTQPTGSVDSQSFIIEVYIR